MNWDTQIDDDDMDNHLPIWDTDNDDEDDDMDIELDIEGTCCCVVLDFS